MRVVMSTDLVLLPTRFEKICRLGSSTKGMISDIYQILVDPTPDVRMKHAYMKKRVIFRYLVLPRHLAINMEMGI